MSEQFEEKKDQLDQQSVIEPSTETNTVISEVIKPIEFPHPGPINKRDQVKNFTLQEQFLQAKYENQDEEYQILTSSVENQDYVLVSDDVWKILFETYGGNDIPRQSINLNKNIPQLEQEPQKKDEFVVEVLYKKVMIYILPKLRTHQYLKQAAAVYVSRQASVLDLRKKIAQVLRDSQGERRSIIELMDMSRLWKLDPSETVYDVEKYYECESKESLPLQIDGKVLEDNQLLEDLNISENDILLYEVQAWSFLTKNNKYSFQPTQKKQERCKQNKNFLLDINPENLKEEYLMSLPLDKCLEKNSKGGLTGLQNLGNTCYMNSVLQCLSNTEPLTKFLIFDCYQSHINKNNFLGTQGKLAIAFSDLLYEMYVGHENSIAPWDVKNIISRRAVQFSGFAQHDSQEILSFLLETMHEDLNDVTKKPYVEQKDYDNRSDEEVSKEYWDGFKKRERSIFIELFYGQLKSRVQCTVCGKISISFDPFNMLSVPIPIIKENVVNVKYFPYSLKQPHKLLKINVGEYDSVTDLKQKVQDILNVQNMQDLFIGLMKKKDQIDVINREKFVKNITEKGEEIVVFERPLGIVEGSFIMELKLFLIKRGWTMMSYPHCISYSRLIVLERRMTVREAKIEIYKYFRPLIDMPEIKGLSEKERQFLNESRQIEEEYKFFFENKSNKSQQPYQIQIFNNMPFEEGTFFGTTQESCAFCNKSHKGSNCSFDLGDSMTMRQVLSKVKKNLDLELALIFNPNSCLDISKLQNIQYKDHETYQPILFKKHPVKIKNAISIYDCFNWFSQEETLTGNDMWYCPTCKSHQIALKKMEIYKCPDYLIVHLKRFSHAKSLYSRKLEEIIEFPVENLDLSKQILSQEKKNSIYDLYAVSNHFGSLNGGHYTAYAKNAINSEWYEFDDSHVNPIQDKESIVNKASYVLFYKRRGA
ncbi:ubiquitin carboxyl-terminal hydrolase [Stylonychia lemnae]|uniref:Ubiquitin carboxyl-terminal hydrolase n=1 Tax=Stylonychia lemnae TaxID=5949 RepID=A0A078B0G7_STYLE|nr:ubiquitin carboxyl-terminal hydrolase [Stylonychia lemnae]|eukprot:CDW86593.1 ubiquitin carboxyl-terminal hydrolase [Stylonychia lemnae]